jgi:hypothetical protein
MFVTTKERPDKFDILLNVRQYVCLFGNFLVPQNVSSDTWYSELKRRPPPSSTYWPFLCDFFALKIPEKFSAERFPLKMYSKNGIFREKKVLKKSFYPEIPRKIPRKVILRGEKLYKKLTPGLHSLPGYVHM